MRSGVDPKVLELSSSARRKALKNYSLVSSPSFAHGSQELGIVRQYEQLHRLPSTVLWPITSSFYKPPRI
jgi:hypothetical protein